LPATTVVLRSGRRVGTVRVPFTARGYIPGMALPEAIWISANIFMGGLPEQSSFCCLCRLSRRDE
jgi:hypothetical protein